LEGFEMTMKTITYKKRTHKILVADKQAIQTLMSQKGVGLISQLTTGTGKRTRSLEINPHFISRVHNLPGDLKHQPQYVQAYAKKHPRAYCFVVLTPLGRKVGRLLKGEQ
jgi:hypothetical protein